MPQCNEDLFVGHILAGLLSCWKLSMGRFHQMGRILLVKFAGACCLVLISAEVSELHTLQLQLCRVHCIITHGKLNTTN